MQIQNDVRLAERERIARDLHDTLLQGFHGIMLRLQAVMKDLPPSGNAQKQLASVLDRADQVILEGRERVSVLRSIAQLEGNLTDAVETVGLQLVEGCNIKFQCAVLGKPTPLRADIFEEMYQIAREAVSNACRHSGASEITVEFSYAPRSLKMKIEDNGIGIDEIVQTMGKVGHWGLSGMRERAQRIEAAFAITSSKNSGTTIDIRVPGRFAYKKDGPRSL
jgi:signal transduction histidine kinase